MKEIKTNKRLQDSLMPNESVIKVAQYTKALFVPGIAFAIIMLTALTAVESAKDAFELLLTIIVFTAVICFPAIKNNISNVLAVTTKKIYGRTGLIKTNELESPLSKIQDIKVEHSFIGRFLKYGTVRVFTINGSYEFKYIKNPESFRKAVMAQIEATEYDKMDIHAERIASAISRTNK